MSSSRVKRRYDSFLGEDSAMAASPQCSPMRITSLGAAAGGVELPPSAQQQQQPASSSSSFPSFSFGTPASSSSSCAAPSSSPCSSPTPSYSSPSPAAARALLHAKRARRQGQSDVCMDGAEEEEQQEGAHQSHFQRLKRPPIDELMFVPRHYKKQAIAAALNNSSSSSSSSSATPVGLPIGAIPAPPSSNPSAPVSHQHQLFTYDQVASIVRNALEMREEQIRDEYNRTLQELLREQFENFSMFNRDYISRNMKSLDQQDSEYSYYS